MCRVAPNPFPSTVQPLPLQPVPFCHKWAANHCNVVDGETTLYIVHSGMALCQISSLLALARGIALAAIDRSVLGRLEGNLCLFAAGCADSGEHLTVCFASVLSLVAAGLASLRLVLEAFLGIELLLTCSERKLLAAFLAYKDLVLVHDFLTSLLIW